MSIGDARRRNIKICGNWKLNPYCQGIQRIRIGIPGSSANIRRGVPIFVTWLKEKVLIRFKINRQFED
jgi:hypothetical protein